jgi:DNA polymerase III subunit gamma/tau
MRLRDATSKKILLEVALLKAIEARNALSLDLVLKELQKLRADQGGEVVSIPLPALQPPAAAPSPKPFRARAESTTPAAAAKVTLATEQMREEAPSPTPEASIESLWASLVEAVGRASPFTKTYLLEAHPVSFAKNVFTIGFDPEVEDHIGLVDNSRNHELLQTKLRELGHPNAQIKFIKAEAPGGRARLDLEPAAKPSPAPKSPPAKSEPRPAAAVATPAKEKSAPVAFSKDDFKNDPLIQKALEVFKGQIVQVRA